MRAFFIGITLLALAVGLALLAQFDRGNVVLFFPPYRVDLSLNLFAILALGAFLFLYGLVRLARKTFQLPERVAQYRARQREKKAYRALRASLQNYFEGRYGHAEKDAEQAQGLPETAGLAALLAARSAHRMTEYARRDEWLRRADQEDGLRAARLMTEAECLVDARDSQRALGVVAQLHVAGARHIQSLRLALKAYQYAGEWGQVLRLLRVLNKRDAIHPAAARQIKSMAYRDLLSSRQGDSYGLIAFWQDVPASDKRAPDIALAAAQAFNAAGLGYQARIIIEGALAEEWDARLVREYALCRADSNAPQIERAERWLAGHPDDAALAYSLGVLCAREKLWGKARHYLAAALTSDRDETLYARIHVELAQVCEEIGESEEAARHFRLAAIAAA
jgi:HemY protein